MASKMDGLPKRIVDKLAAYGLTSPEDVSRVASTHAAEDDKAGYLAFLGPKSDVTVREWLKAQRLPYEIQDDPLPRCIHDLERGHKGSAKDRAWLLAFLKDIAAKR